MAVPIFLPFGIPLASIAFPNAPVGPLFVPRPKAISPKTPEKPSNTTKIKYHRTLYLPTVLTDALGNLTFYQYDRNGNVTKIVYPDTSSVYYRYDKAGRLVQMTAQNGLETKIGYDGNGNIADAGQQAGNRSRNIIQYVLGGGPAVRKQAVAEKDGSQNQTDNSRQQKK